MLLDVSRDCDDSDAPPKVRKYNLNNCGYSTANFQCFKHIIELPSIVQFPNKAPVFKTESLKEICVGCTLLDLSKMPRVLPNVQTYCFFFR